MNMKRYIAILIALVAMATGTKAATDYGFAIGGISIDSENYSFWKDHHKDAFAYNPINKVLTLSGVISCNNYNKAAISINGDVNPHLKIQVDGNCYIYGECSLGLEFTGSGDHTICGNGKLTISPATNGAHGIMSLGNNTKLTIQDLTINITVLSSNGLNAVGFNNRGFSEINLTNCEMNINTDYWAWYGASGYNSVNPVLTDCYLESGYFKDGGIMDPDGMSLYNNFIETTSIKRCKTVDVVSVSIAEPAIGNTIATSCQTGDRYYVKSLEWYRVNDGGSWSVLHEGEVFQYGGTYRLQVDVKLNNGVMFSQSKEIQAQINGKTSNVIYKGTDNIVFSYSFPQLADTYYDVWVGGKQVNNINKSDVLGDGKVSFIKNIFGKYVLILENATITNTGNPDYEFTGYGRGIYTKIQGLNIRVKGNNTIESKGEGIYFNDNLEISGTTNDQGKLSVKGSFGIRPERAKVTTLSISNVDLTAEGTSGAGIGAQTSLSSNSYNCTLNVSAAKTVVKAKGTSVSLGNLKSLVLEDGLQFVQPNGAYFDGEDVRDGNGTRVVNQWVVIRGNTSIATGLEAIDNGQLTIDSSLPLYNLQGQRVSYPVKGQIYIQNGRKVKF